MWFVYFILVFLLIIAYIALGGMLSTAIEVDREDMPAWIVFWPIMLLIAGCICLINIIRRKEK